MKMAYEFELDIVTGFYEADDKRAYIETCAVDYGLTVEDVRGILIEGGVDARKLPRAKRGKKNAVAAESIKGGEPEDPVFDAVMQLLDDEVEKVQQEETVLRGQPEGIAAPVCALARNDEVVTEAGKKTEETLRQPLEIGRQDVLNYIRDLKRLKKALEEQIEDISIELSEILEEIESGY